MKKNKKNSAVPKNSELYNILKGVSLEDVNKARGEKSSIRIEINPNAEKIEEVKMSK